MRCFGKLLQRSGGLKVSGTSTYLVRFFTFGKRSSASGGKTIFRHGFLHLLLES